MDNSCKMVNFPEELHHLYKEAVSRLWKGGFDLRSCKSNCEPLKKQMEKDNRIVEHHSEKVLGYKYNPKMDTLPMSNMEVDQNVKTKRGVLSQTARVFDPLSICIPVMRFEQRVMVSKIELRRCDIGTFTI